jgi:hypothetical protein
MPESIIALLEEVELTLAGVIILARIINHLLK